MNYVLGYVGGGVGAENNRGYRGGRRAIVDQRDNLTRFMMHGKLTASGVELMAKKVASNKVRGRGSDPRFPPKKVGLAKSRLLGSLFVKDGSK